MIVGVIAKLTELFLDFVPPVAIVLWLVSDSVRLLDFNEGGGAKWGV
jgi:hypothetical protein